MPRRIAVAAVVAAVGTVWVGAQLAAPDTIYVNGTIITMDPQARSVTVVATLEDCIVSVGADPEIRRLAGSGTRVVDLRQRTMLSESRHPTRQELDPASIDHPILPVLETIVAGRTIYRRN